MHHIDLLISTYYCTGRNCLIKKICQCASILFCTCSEDTGNKFDIFLADFDYICSATADNIDRPGGTFTSRPPEVNKDNVYQLQFDTVFIYGYVAM